MTMPFRARWLALALVAVAVGAGTWALAIRDSSQQAAAQSAVAQADDPHAGHDHAAHPDWVSDNMDERARALEKLLRQIAAKKLAQYPFALPLPDFHIKRQPPGKFSNSLIQKRCPAFQ